MSSSRFAPVQVIACTLSWRIISASDNAELGRAHRAGDRHEHLAAAIEMAPIGVSGVDHRGGVEVPESDGG